MKRKVLLVVVVLVLVAGVALYLLLRGPDRGLAFHWPAGTEYVYGLSYTTHNRTNLSFEGAGGDGLDRLLSADVELVGELVVRSWGKEKDRYVLGMGLRSFSRHRLDFMEQELLPDEAAVEEKLIGHEGLVEVDGRGRVSGLYFKPGTPALFRNVMQSLVGELQVLLEKETAKWTVEERNQHGRGPVEYALEASDPEGFDLGKSRREYQELAVLEGRRGEVKQEVGASYAVRVSREGHLERYAGQEKIRAGKEDEEQPVLSVETAVSLELRSVGSFEAPDSVAGLLTGLDQVLLGEVYVSSEALERALAQRVGGLKIEQVVDDVATYGNGGRVPFHSKWVWRTTGLLELRPKDCWKLVPAFQNPKLQTKGKALILDLLSGVGHQEAQAVLRKLLDSKAARTDPRYHSLFQRLSLVEHPNVETAKFVQKELGRTRGAVGDERNVHYASAYSLGSVSKKLAGDSSDRGATYNDELRALLQGAESPEDRRHYLSALGNAARAENVEMVATYATDPSFQVRKSVATALRDTQTARSEQVVLELAGDEHPRVQQSALGTLGRYDLRPEHLTRLQSLVKDDRLESRNFGTLTRVLTKQLDSGPETKKLSQQTLGLLLNKELGGKLRLRIRNLLKSSQKG